MADDIQSAVDDWANVHRLSTSCIVVFHKHVPLLSIRLRKTATIMAIYISAKTRSAADSATR